MIVLRQIEVQSISEVIDVAKIQGMSVGCHFLSDTAGARSSRESEEGGFLLGQGCHFLRLYQALVAIQSG